VLICKDVDRSRYAQVKFGESACRRGSLKRQTSNEFLLRVLRIMGYQVV